MSPRGANNDDSEAHNGHHQQQQVDPYRSLPVDAHTVVYESGGALLNAAASEAELAIEVFDEQLLERIRDSQ